MDFSRDSMLSETPKPDKVDIDERVVHFLYTKDFDIYKSQKPFIILSHFEGVTDMTNLKWFNFETEKVRNIRGHENIFTLDEHGFAFLKDICEFKEWTDRKRVEEDYLPHIETLLQQNVDFADEVKIFDWRVL
jgi:hypothetical protein